MKILGLIFCFIFILFFLFAKIKINNKTNVTIIERVYVSIIASIIFTLVLGLPILGIIKLLGF